MIGIISDIHAHEAQLERVLAALAERGVKRVWCLGDIVGIGPQPEGWREDGEPLISGAGEASKRSWDRVQKTCSVILAGNHDKAVTMDTELSRFPGWAQQGIEQAQNYLLGDERFRSLSCEQVEYVWDEPVRIVHGMPGDPVWGFLSGPGEAYFALQHCDERLILCGHTHRAAWGHDRYWNEVPEMGFDDRLVFESGQRYILNPGAVMSGSYGILHMGASGTPVSFEFNQLPVPADWEPRSRT